MSTDYSKLSDKELIERHKIGINQIDYCKNMQHQLKITLNSGYGAL
jgi:hypothetical protein